MNRAERRHRTACVVRRRVRFLRGMGDRALLGRATGRWRRRAPYDCGRPGCGVCRGTADDVRAARRRERLRRVGTDARG